MDYSKIEKTVKDEMEWDDLSPIFKKKIEESLAKHVEMKIQNLSETVCGQVLVDLINDKDITLFSRTIPEELLVSYYIPRVIIKRMRLDEEKLFQEKSVNEIFLFTGMDRMELRKYVKTGMTTNSSAVLQNGTDSRFIVLQSPSHIQIICRNNTGRSVHLIEFKKGEFNWVTTCGKVKTIQKMIITSGEEEYNEINSLDQLQETEFIDKVIANDDIRIVCLSDTSGMGKSVLLANIGQQLKNKFQSKRVVIFLSISEVFKSIKTTNEKSLESALHYLACKNNLEKEIISGKLASAELEIELLLDGFDEIEWERLESAIEFLNFIQKFNSIRLWVSTRPHHLEKLEQKLNTIGYNIKPFDKKDQINFLTSFWTSKNQSLDNNKLEAFARKVLEILSSTTTQGTCGSAREVAGIPLQCQLLAELYEKKAAVFSSCIEDGIEKEDMPVLEEVNSVTALYTALVEHKFRKYHETYFGKQKLNRLSLYSVHSKLAFQLIYPDWFDKNIAYLFEEIVNLEELLNVGLLERKNTSSATNNFIHRTFAEYFCAFFFAGMIFTKDLSTEKFFSFFYDGFLSTSDTADDSLNIYFRNSVPCYFLDSLILDRGKTPFQISLPIFEFLFRKIDFYRTAIRNYLNWIFPVKKFQLSSKNISSNELQTFLLACSNHNFQTLFYLFTDLLQFKGNVSDIIDEEFLIHSIKQHRFEMLKVILIHFKKHSEFSARLSSTALLAAVETVDESKLEYFLNVQGLLGKLLGNPDVELSRLFEKFFSCTYYRNKTFEISSRTSPAISMINLLVETEKRVFKSQVPSCKSLSLQSKHCNWELALINKKTSFRVRLELIKLGANILQTDEKGNNFLHLRAWSDASFLQYFQQLSASRSPKEIKTLVKMTNNDGFTPLASAFKNNLKLSKECMGKWKEAGVDFTEVHNNTSLFLLAIKSGNNEEVLQFMIDNGVDVYWKKEQTNKGRAKVKTYLDYAAKAGNSHAIRLLVVDHGMDVNGLDEDSKRPLDYIIQNWNNKSSENYFLSAEKLWELGGRFKQMAAIDLKEIVFQRRELYLLKFTLDKCLDVNEVDNNGNTWLHLLVQKWKDPEAIKIAVEAGGDLHAKNRKELTPLDLALITKNIEKVRLLKPSEGFQWSYVSSSITASVFEAFLAYSAKYISDKHEFLPFFEEVIRRSITTNWMHSLIKTGDYFPWQFHLMTEHLLSNSDLVMLLTTVDKKGATILHYALKNIKGIEEKTLKKLQKIIDFKVKDKNGKSMLYYAVEGGQSPEILEMLHTCGGGDFKGKTTLDKSLLHAAALSGQEDLNMVNFLLKKGVDPNWVDVNGDTPLHCFFQTNCMRYGIEWKLEFTEVLFKAGAKPEIKNKNDNTFFELAMRQFRDKLNQNWTYFHKFAKVFRIVWKYSISSQRKALNSCLNFYSTEIEDCVFGCGQNLTSEEFFYFTNEILDLKNECFPIKTWKEHLTPSNFHLLVQSFIDTRRAKAFFTQTRMQALHHVVSIINVEERTLKLLLEKGIDLGVKDEKGWSLLFHAINRNWTSLKDFKLLEKYGGGTMMEKDNSGQNLLHVAVNKFGRHVENSIVVEYLLEKKGLNPNDVDNEGNTPLHILLENLDKLTYEITTKAGVFIQAGAKVDLKNSKGITVEDLANRVKEDSVGLKEHLLAIISTSKES